jgi:hypothetical protein
MRLSYPLAVVSTMRDVWQKHESLICLALISGALAQYVLCILLLYFQLGDDLIVLSYVRRASVQEIFTSSIFGDGAFYRPLVLLVAKLLVTPSLSVLPYRIALALTTLCIFALVAVCLRNLRISLFGTALAVFFLIGSPFTFGTFTWWADVGSRHVLIAFLVGATYVTSGKPPPVLLAQPILIFALLSQEVGLAVSAFYFFVYLIFRDRRGAGSVLLLVLGYFVLRFAVLGTMISYEPFLHLPQGLFFETIKSGSNWQEMFGGRYQLIYLYNVIAQFFAVFLAQPYEGLLSFGEWRLLLFFLLQTASTIVIALFLFRAKDTRTLRVFTLFFLMILCNVLVGYSSTRFRTLAVAGVSYMVLFVWAADTIWHARSSISLLPRWITPLVFLLFIGWGGSAALRIADLGDHIRDQGKQYILLIESPNERIDHEVYRMVRARWKP